MAESHKEAVGGDVEGGEVDEGTHMMKDDEHQEVTSTDASARTCRQPSMLPEG